jgi:hypothetical protein
MAVDLKSGNSQYVDGVELLYRGDGGGEEEGTAVFLVVVNLLTGL